MGEPSGPGDGLLSAPLVIEYPFNRPTGPVIGAFLVNLAKSFFTQAFPQLWLFFLGGVFVLVTLALPGGVISLLKRRSADEASSGGGK